MISCKNCEDQFIQWAIDFKGRFRIHTSDIKTKKGRCGAVSHFNSKCSDVQNAHRFLQIQLIESVVGDLDLENNLWERANYWQSQLFTNIHGMDSVSDLYASKTKGFRKNNLLFFIILYLVVWYHHCFMLGTITALCHHASAN